MPSGALSFDGLVLLLASTLFILFLLASAWVFLLKKKRVQLSPQSLDYCLDSFSLSDQIYCCFLASRAGPSSAHWHPLHPLCEQCTSLGATASWAEWVPCCWTQPKRELSAFSFYNFLATLEHVDTFLLCFHWDSSLVGLLTFLGHSFSTFFVGSSLFW